MQIMKILSFFYLLVTLLLTGCDGGSSENVLPLAVSQATPPNTAPVAKISSSSEGFVASTEVSFTGRESSDAEDDSLTYLWSLEKPDFSLAKLNNTTDEVISFRPDAIGKYTLTLAVTDTKNKSTSITKSFIPSLPEPKPLPIFAATPPPVGVIIDE